MKPKKNKTSAGLASLEGPQNPAVPSLQAAPESPQAADLIERKRAEEALRQSEERFRVTYERAPVGICEATLEGHLTNVNPRFCEITGYSREELLQKTFQDLTHPDDVQADVDQYRKVQAGELPFYTQEQRYLHKDGQVVWIDLMGTVVRDGQGRPAFGIGIIQDITERKKTEAAIVEARNALERETNILQSVMNGAKNSHLVFLDRDFNFVKVNETYARTCGYSPEEMVGKNHFALYPHPENEAIFARVRDTGQPAAYHDKPFEFPDQPERGVTYWDWTLTPVKNAAGNVMGLVFSLFETTERKRAEEALRASDERLAQAVQVAGLGSFAHDHSSDLIEYSPALREMMGFGEKEKITIDAILNGIMPEDREAVAAAIRRAHDPAGDGMFEVEYRVVRPDGRVRWVSKRSQTFFEGEGSGRRPVRTVGAVLDVTERKQTESNQALVAEVLRALNRSGGDLHSMVAQTLRLIKEWTGFDAVGLRLRQGGDCPYYEQSGFSECFLKEENFLCAKRGDGAILRDTEDRVVLECTCGLVLSGRTEPSMACFTKDGSFWTNRSTELLALPLEEDPRTNPRNTCIHVGYQSVALVPVRSGAEILGLLQLNDRREGRFTLEMVRFFEGLADNIGLCIKRKVAEERLGEAKAALERYSEELEQRVAERTAKLQEAVGELEHFSYTITHDMRAPLRAIQGFGQMLLNDCADALNPQHRDLLRRMAVSAGRMDSLITDALQYTKVIRQEIDLEPIDAAALLRTMVESYPQFQPPQAEVKIEDHIPRVLGNEAALTQCFSNLLGNAVKFVRPGQTPKVRVWGETRGDLMRLWFEDNGIGIAEEHCGQIFEMFNQLNKNYEGTGIGLALVHKVVKRMKGDVGVESEEGKGSRFWVELKRCG